MGVGPFTMAYRPRPYAYSLPNDPGVSVNRIRRTRYFTSHGPPNKEIFRKQKNHRLKLMRQMQRHYITPFTYNGLNTVPISMRK